MVRHGGSSAGSYLADPTSPIPSHCASIVATSTVRVNSSEQIQLVYINCPCSEEFVSRGITMGPSETFGVMYGHTLFLCLQITSGLVKLAVSLVIADGHLTFLVGLCGQHAHFIIEPRHLESPISGHPQLFKDLGHSIVHQIE